MKQKRLENLELFPAEEELRIEKEERSLYMPLAARMRPANLEEFLGQEEIVGPGKLVRRAIEEDRVPSMIFWGPPGSGKTTLARIIANSTKAHFSSVSAVSAGVSDLRRIIEEAKERRRATGRKTILFIDEIHRFNKAQQDAVLPYVEDGEITLIGATTENPSFEVISALISRCRVCKLESLKEEEIRQIVLRALADNKRGIGSLKVEITDEALEYLVGMSNGDARVALNALEMAVLKAGEEGEVRGIVTLESVQDALQKRSTLYDKKGDYHYDLISALHKSLRNSDVQAALYWMARMLEGGEDPLYIVRRLVRFASEDIGLADPQALIQALAAKEAVHFVGMPEADSMIAQAVIYLATAPKSNSVYEALQRVKKDVQEERQEPVPLHLRNPVTALMKGFGYGRGYKYAHDFPEHHAKMQCLPANLKDRVYYRPGKFGFESEIARRLAWWKSLEEKKKEP